jgi:hypothetical protein
MDTAAALKPTGSRRWRGQTGRLPAMLLLVAGSLNAVAEPESEIAATVNEAVTAASNRPAGAMNVTPELSAVHTRLAPSAVAPTAAGGRPLSDLAGVDYRLWMSHGRAQWGVGVGTLGYVQPHASGRVEGPMSLIDAAPTVSLGLRYRVTPESSVFANASGTRGLGSDTANAYVNAKVGMEWKPAKPRFGFDHGAIGMQFDSGYALSLKARQGGVGLYLRGKF